MSNYHFYFGGGFQVGAGSSQTAGQRPRDPGHREHVSPDSSHRKRPAVELLSKQEAKSRRSKHPRSRSRGQRFREASSKSRSLSSDDHIQPVLHAPSCKLPPRPSSPPPGFVGFIHIIHTHQPNPAISRMMERLTHRSGGSHPRAHMRTPQRQQQPHCFPLLQHQQKVAIHALIQCPFMFQNSEPIHMSTCKQQQKQLRHFQGN